jgi:5-deoxy-glucuronate isomerase
MSHLLSQRRPPDEHGCTQKITPESADWEYVGFEVYHLESQRELSGCEEGRETCLVLLSGLANVTTLGEEWLNIGERTSPFDDQAPYAVYIPPGQDYTVSAITPLELAICSAPAVGKLPARLITPDQCVIEERGAGTNRRHIRNILFGNAEAERLLVVEVITPNGNWSSYPPHKHDTDAIPNETHLEETYYHRLNPPQGFAFQRVYTDDRSLDETMSVEDGDVVMVPRGYHPVGAPHGYDLYYLNVMAGPKREWIFHNDPAHEWMLTSR